ncbi:glycosyltransferase [Aliiglaciecola sp. M165]|uniref:glycosyltransferase n=1 Tax=Aliiglaciecola sp. M165 TaxID=2593649 RepID=UPI00117CFB7A|nr:glycosyltransferase [Aliiglaciecola sp. M165]TRY30827.1 glycosyltransferase [Aliiglaciecola sp. M165]
MPNEKRCDAIIDVVMACYREPIPWLSNAIDSILTQSETRFKFVIVLDDPDNLEIKNCLSSFQAQDDRIEVIINEQNLGLAASLNRAIQASSSPFIARMDADDISLPERLKIQLDYLNANPEYALIGSAIENIDENQTVLGIKTFESKPALLKKMIPFCSVACHPTWMFRRQDYDDVQGYRNLSTAQDYDFLYRLIDANKRITNLPQPLVKYRIHNSSITSGMSLKRYKIRRYIHDMHQDRVRYGKDEFSEEILQSYVAQAKASKTISKLLTKLRQAEEKQSPLKIFYMGLLTVLSADVRQRVIDHIQLKWLMARHPTVDK